MSETTREGSIPHETQPLQQIPCIQGECKQVLSFHERLNASIILWAMMIDALLQVDTHECYKLAFALLDLQPDALYFDYVPAARTESEAEHG